MNARQIWETWKFDFEIQSKTDSRPVYCTTEVALMWATALKELGCTFDIIAVHPEFLGWTVEEIEENKTEDDEE